MARPVDEELVKHLKEEHGLEDVSIYTASLESVHHEIHRNIESIGVPFMVVGVDPDTGATQLLNEEQIAAHSATLGDAGMSTCPMCKKHWLVTMRNDCLVPRCGCYGFGTGAENLNRPCEPCGIRHAMSCDKKPVPDV